MTAERTALESALIPVTAYILISGIECYRRYPDLMAAIAAAKPPAEIGAAGRRPGNQIDAVHLWSIANIALVGRQILAPFGMIDPVADLETLDAIFGFWEPAAAAFRGDGHRQAWDAGFTVPRYGPDVIAELVAGTTPITDDAARATLSKLNAALTSFLFLLYFDTRAGYQDTGPYPLPDGRTLLVRDFNEMAVSHFPWSADDRRRPAAREPHRRARARRRGREGERLGHDGHRPGRVPLARRSQPGSSTRPAARSPRSPSASSTTCASSVKRAQKDLYRLIAGMSRAEKIDAGAYVYFTFLRPFARVAGVEDDARLDRPTRQPRSLRGALDDRQAPRGHHADPDVPYYTPLP